MPQDVLIWLADHHLPIAPHLAEEPVGEDDDFDVNCLPIED